MRQLCSKWQVTSWSSSSLLFWDQQLPGVCFAHSGQSARGQALQVSTGEAFGASPLVHHLYLPLQDRGHIQWSQERHPAYSCEREALKGEKRRRRRRRGRRRKRRRRRRGGGGRGRRRRRRIMKNNYSVFQSIITKFTHCLLVLWYFPWSSEIETLAWTFFYKPSGRSHILGIFIHTVQQLHVSDENCPRNLGVMENSLELMISFPRYSSCTFLPSVVAKGDLPGPYTRRVSEGKCSKRPK